MADAKKLSSMDASFLYLETPEMPMHVGNMASACRRVQRSFARTRAMIASRCISVLKARLKGPLDVDHPSWVKDDQFDIDRHLRGSLPAPRGRATLEPSSAGCMPGPQRAQPLEFYIFEGRDNEIGPVQDHNAHRRRRDAALTNMIYDAQSGARAATSRRDCAANLIDSYKLWRQR